MNTQRPKPRPQKIRSNSGWDQKQTDMISNRSRMSQASLKVKKNVTNRQMRACMSPLPVANSDPCGDGATDITILVLACSSQSK